MSDQHAINKPALSLEEELDVLEAVYRIGQKKGLDLLRPEQVKKLRDAGRMGINRSKKISLKSDEELVGSSYRIVNGLLSALNSHSDGVGKHDEEQLFQKMYGMSSEEMGFKIFSSLKGAQNAAVS